MKYILSYGGGVNSTALLFYIVDNNLPLDLVIFADTGVESKKTYLTINKIMKYCLKNKIPFQKVKSKYGNLYDYYYNNKCVMSMRFRDCTSKFKIAPIRQHLRKRFEERSI